MSRRRAGSGSGLGSAVPVVQLDLFAEQDQADSEAAAVAEAAALLAAAGEEVIDTATLARLCRVEAEALDARDRDDQQRFGRGRFFAEEWVEAGGPVRTRRERPGNRHVPGRAPGGGYDLAAASVPTGTQQDDDHEHDDHQPDEHEEQGA